MTSDHLTLLVMFTVAARNSLSCSGILATARRIAPIGTQWVADWCFKGARRDSGWRQPRQETDFPKPRVASQNLLAGRTQFSPADQLPTPPPSRGPDCDPESNKRRCPCGRAVSAMHGDDHYPRHHCCDWPTGRQRPARSLGQGAPEGVRLGSAQWALDC